MIPARLEVQLLVTFLMVAYLCFMEWIFFFTKPSFLSTASLPEALGILLRAPLLPGVLLGLGTLVLGASSRLVKGRAASFLELMTRLVPASVFAVTLLLMLDNFTYTVLGMGVKTATGAWKLVYLPVLAGLWRTAYQLVLAFEENLLTRPSLRAPRAALATWVGLATLACVLASDRSPPRDTGSETAKLGTGRRLPNILLLASDGLAAERLQLYGAARPTTPFLASFLEERRGRTLFCENAFPNGSNTGASVMSFLTGKYPTTTRVYHAPDILKGLDSYQHLPGLLHRLGYRNLSISIRHYADAYDFSMLHAFDESNDQRVPSAGFEAVGTGLVGQETVYLLALGYERIRNRLQYLAGLRESVDSFFQATGKRPFNVNDLERMTQFFGFVDETPGPFFAQLHLTGTHGPRFYPTRQVFSQGQHQIREWMADLYDDAVLDFDGFFRQIVEGLATRGRLEDTLVVLHSDHGPRVEYSLGYSSTVRVPLVFFLPQGEDFPAVSGRQIRSNVQNLDIPPTLLEYLGQEVPEWMEGRSVLRADPAPLRPIFSAESVETVHGDQGWVVDESRAGAPYFSLGAVGLVLGDRRYCLELRQLGLLAGEVAGQTQSGTLPRGPSPEEAVGMLRQHLLQAGYPAEGWTRIHLLPVPPHPEGAP